MEGGETASRTAPGAGAPIEKADGCNPCEVPELRDASLLGLPRDVRWGGGSATGICRRRMGIFMID